MPIAINTFQWVVIPFNLKNVGTTYQRVMNIIFHDLIDKTMEVYNDNIVVKGESYEEYIENLFKPLRECIKWVENKSSKMCIW